MYRTKPPSFSVDEVIEAIKQARGMKYLAAQNLGCSEPTILYFESRYPEVALAIREARGYVTDVAETKLFEAIERGDPWAIQFFLKTIGKHRGYVERQEHTGAEGGPLTFRAVRSLSDRELEEVVSNYKEGGQVQASSVPRLVEGSQKLGSE